MKHYTLNTGKTIDAPPNAELPQNWRRELAAANGCAVEWIKKGEGTLPSALSNFRVTINNREGSALFTVLDKQEPIVICGVAWTKQGADKVWQEIEKIYLDLIHNPQETMEAIGDPAQPNSASLPWLAVVKLPAFHKLSCDSVDWLEDFERCMAWAIIDWNERWKPGTP